MFIPPKYCPTFTWLFRSGFIFANFTSQTSRKFPLQFMSIYSNENLRKIMKLNPHKFSHLVQNCEIICTRKLWRIQYLYTVAGGWIGRGPPPPFFGRFFLFSGAASRNLDSRPPLFTDPGSASGIHVGYSVEQFECPLFSHVGLHQLIFFK